MKKFAALLLVLALMLSVLAGCGSTSKTAEASGETVKIGVITYSATDSEALMFRSYLENNLGNAFGVDYLYSNMVTSLEDEKAFVDQAKEAGCKGVLAFITYDLAGIVDYCGEGFFYALQNMTPTEEEYNAVKDKPQFLGIVSPSNEEEYQSGTNIAAALLGDEAESSQNWLVFTGGASYGNNMHTQRAKGIMEELTKSGYELTCSMDEVLTVQEPVAVASGKDGGAVYICPGYPSVHTENMEKALAMCDADRIAGCCSLESIENQLKEYRKQHKDMKLGLVDCFSETVASAVANDGIDYLVGKYGAMVAPTFVALMNAVFGNEDLVKENGEAYWMTQSVWTAGDKESFLQLYSDSVNVYDNTYCSDELMDAIAAYNPQASHADLLNLVEAR